MARFINVIMILIVCVMICLCKEDAKTMVTQIRKINLVDSNDKPSMTSLEFEKQILELGEIKLGETNIARFKLKNKGRIPLVLSDVSSSCGCTVPKWTKEPIKPNDTIEIMVQVTLNSKGYFRKTITVYCNTPSSPITLQIKGNVK